MYSKALTEYGAGRIRMLLMQLLLPFEYIRIPAGAAGAPTCRCDPGNTNVCRKVRAQHCQHMVSAYPMRGKLEQLKRSDVQK